MDGITNRFAIIINSYYEERFIDDVERSLEFLENPERDYETYVMSPVQPAGADHYTKNNMERLINDLKSKIDGDDELVIYLTGHGSRHNKANERIQLLDEIIYGQRIIISGQCFSGNLIRSFMDDINTLFISCGSYGEWCFTELDEAIWSDYAGDRNGDGVVSWQERYEHAIPMIQLSTPQFLASQGYIQQGNSSFSTGVTRIETFNILTGALGELRAGQYAVINFSGEDDPDFERIAEEAQGQYLFLQVASAEAAEQYGVTTVPDVLIVDYRGNRYHVRNKREVLAEMALILCEHWKSLEYRTFKLLERIIHPNNPVPSMEIDISELELHQIKSIAEDIIQTLGATIRSENTNVYTNTSFESAALPDMINVLRYGNADVCAVIAYALGIMGPAAEIAVPALTTMLKRQKANVRMITSFALGRIGSAAKAAVPELIKALKDEDTRIRECAAWALGKIGSSAEDAVPTLIETLEDKNKNVRYAAIEALIRLKGEEWILGHVSKNIDL